MTSSPVRTQRNRTWWVWPPVVLGLVIPFLAAFVSLALGFGVMTDCTNAYNCTETSCGPCQGAERWLTLGTVVQAVLVVAAIVLAVLAVVRRRGSSALAFTALAICAVSVATVFAIAAAASGSY